MNIEDIWIWIKKYFKKIFLIMSIFSIFAGIGSFFFAYYSMPEEGRKRMFEDFYNILIFLISLLKNPWIWTSLFFVLFAIFYVKNKNLRKKFNYLIGVESKNKRLRIEIRGLEDDYKICSEMRSDLKMENERLKRQRPNIADFLDEHEEKQELKEKNRDLENKISKMSQNNTKKRKIERYRPMGI